MSFHSIKTNIVQSIRAHRGNQLQQDAEALGHHFLYAQLADASSKEEIVASIAEQFTLPPSLVTSFASLFECLTETLYKSGTQLGFVVVLEQIPANAKFDKEARELLLDIFRDAAEYWHERKIPFRCFYSYSVARAAAVIQSAAKSKELDGEEAMPTNKLLDVSPMALRMSSPFNTGYWLASLGTVGTSRNNALV